MSARLQQFGRSIITGERRGVLASITRAALAIVEPIYAAVTVVRNRIYDAGIGVKRLARPVISVGNLTTGGTGKTPTVVWLAQQLKTRGKHPAILMRGYRATDGGSDEQMMLHATLNLPVGASPDRIAEGTRLLSRITEVDVLILDDGFQHRRVARDFDLVLINVNEPFGFDHVLPRGLLREPWRGLRRADAILLTHCDEVPGKTIEQITDRVQKLKPLPVFRSSHRLALEAPTEKFLAFAGIGSPQSFANALGAFGTFGGFESFPDHHDYTQGDVEEIEQAARKAGATLLVTTEKDSSKLRQLKFEMPIIRAGLEIVFSPGDQERLIEQIMAALPANPAA